MYSDYTCWISFPFSGTLATKHDNDWLLAILASSSMVVVPFFLINVNY